MPLEQVERRLASGETEYRRRSPSTRGRTLADAFAILDEAQNTTPMQMKMFLTRFGQNSRMPAICGDPEHTDLPGGTAASGLNDAGGEGAWRRVGYIGMVRFNVADVVRHPDCGADRGSIRRQGRQRLDRGPAEGGSGMINKLAAAVASAAMTT
jgi:phosphate starvation-inducible PhoH-like protein